MSTTIGHGRRIRLNTKNSNEMTFRSKLTLIMSEKDLTIQELSNLLKVSRVSISHWRNGKRTPSTGNLKRMSSLWGIPVDSLLDDDTDLKSFLATETAQREVAV
jgi:transcriptional regulator with XRE-family HTH domain